MTARATVVIVNYNGAHLLPPCLDGLRKQDLPAGDFRTVVVDNASSDGSVELLRRDYPEVEVIESGDNLGFAGGNNLALRQVTTPFAALLNNDAIPDEDWLRTLLAPFEEDGADRLGVTTGKTVFLPRFVRIGLRTPSFCPGSPDRRELGVRVSRVLVDREDIARKVIWDGAGYGEEGSAGEPFWWTRPDGDLLVPVPERLVGQSFGVVFRVSAEKGERKPLTLTVGGGATTFEIGDAYQDVVVSVAESETLVDVINNAGGIVLKDGFGADRGFREVDEGQYDRPVQVFNACGNGLAVRTSLGRELGWFDDDFFMYYEDTDLSWRIRSRGWDILYVPGARLRHVHSASSKEHSPLWTFHVDRNRLLMLTKNATPGLVGRALVLYLGGTGQRTVHAVRLGWRARRRPPLRGVLLRFKVLTSYLQLLPRMLTRRRAGRRHAVQSPAELQRWLVARR